MNILQKQNQINNLELIKLNDDKHEDDVRWIVTLSNNFVVFEDKQSKENSWLNLKKFCETNQIFIKDLRLEFRSHTEYIEPNCAGYFFCYGIQARVGDTKSYHQYVIGTLKNINDEYLEITKWIVPELIISDIESRHINKCKNSLILKEYARK